MVEKERKLSDDSARTEALSIVRAMKNGIDMTDAMTIEPRTAQVLREFCKEHPGDAYIVRNALAFRVKVQMYVDQALAGEDIAAGVTDAEEDDANPLGQSSEAAQSNSDPIAEQDNSFHENCEGYFGTPESTIAEADRWASQGEEESAFSQAEA